MRPLATAPRGASPRVWIEPAVGSSRPSIRPMAVDLPAPLGPSRATVWPIGMSNATLSSATVSPNRLVTPPKEVAGGVALSIAFRVRIRSAGRAIVGMSSRAVVCVAVITVLDVRIHGIKSRMGSGQAEVTPVLNRA